MVRRIEAEDGKFAAAVANWDDASGGMVESDSVEMAFDRFLRRCGSSLVSDSVVGCFRTSA